MPFLHHVGHGHLQTIVRFGSTPAVESPFLGAPGIGATRRWPGVGEGLLTCFADLHPGKPPEGWLDGSEG